MADAQQNYLDDNLLTVFSIELTYYVTSTNTKGPKQTKKNKTKELEICPQDKIQGYIEFLKAALDIVGERLLLMTLIAFRNCANVSVNHAIDLHSSSVGSQCVSWVS